MASPVKLNPVLMDRIAQARTARRVPIAVLDVDLTLIENAPRTRAILRDYAQSLAGEWSGAEAASKRVHDMPLVFSIMENLRALGLSDEDHLRGGFEFWKSTFFTEDYCRRDVPLHGAPRAVDALWREGCTIVYVTARVPQMLEGTVRSLREFGFPIGVVGTVLSMKEALDQRDGAFKEKAFDWIGQLGEVVLCAENEPAYANLMKEAFPNAECVLVDTRHSPDAPPLASGIPRVSSLGRFVTGDEGGRAHAMEP